jgi:hypothetical protein
MLQGLLPGSDHAVRHESIDFDFSSPRPRAFHVEKPLAAHRPDVSIYLLNNSNQKNLRSSEKLFYLTASFSIAGSGKRGAGREALSPSIHEWIWLCQTAIEAATGIGNTNGNRCGKKQKSGCRTNSGYRFFIRMRGLEILLLKI